MIIEQPSTIAEITTQPKIEIVAIQPDSNSVRTTRQEYFLAQATKEKDRPITTPKKEEKETDFETIRIPKGYKICPEDYVCIPKSVYSGQPVIPSTVNSPPQATLANPNPITTFNPNQAPNQNIQQSDL